MTKKFWNDWQKRVGETETIYVNYDGINGKYSYPLFYPRVSTLISAKFNGNEVELTYDTKTTVFGRNGIYYHVERTTKTLHRKYISTVEFKINNYGRI